MRIMDQHGKMIEMATRKTPEPTIDDSIAVTTIALQCALEALSVETQYELAQALAKNCRYRLIGEDERTTGELLKRIAGLSEKWVKSNEWNYDLSQAPKDKLLLISSHKGAPITLFYGYSGEALKHYHVYAWKLAPEPAPLLSREEIINRTIQMLGDKKDF